MWTMRYTYRSIQPSLQRPKPLLFAQSLLLSYIFSSIIHPPITIDRLPAKWSDNELGHGKSWCNSTAEKRGLMVWGRQFPSGMAQWVLVFQILCGIIFDWAVPEKSTSFIKLSLKCGVKVSTSGFAFLPATGLRNEAKSCSSVRTET
jgi:hypothetical protein